jgi:hypothetical protein
MDIKFFETFPDELAECSPGDICKIWVTPDALFANVYRPGSFGGHGQIATIDLDDHPGILAREINGEKMWLELTACTETRFEFKMCAGETVPRMPPVFTPSGVRGVSWHAVTGKWKVTYRTRHFGLYATVEEAGAALQAAKAVS